MPPPSTAWCFYELTPEKTSLEEAFMELTHEATEYRAVDTHTSRTPPTSTGRKGSPHERLSPRT